ncbi:glycosyl transferase family 39, partial [Candidatus Roizmanbacteria bacterium CG17_big_fil_post_rev_8_21_14_2_50_39_7]
MHITIILIFAFFLRLINLDQSLWLDETIVVKVVQTIPFHLIPFQFSPGDFHPPLYYLV